MSLRIAAALERELHGKDLHIFLFFIYLEMVAHTRPVAIYIVVAANVVVIAIYYFARC